MAAIFIFIGSFFLIFYFQDYLFSPLWQSELDCIKEVLVLLCHRHILWVGNNKTAPGVPKERFVHSSGIFYPLKVPMGLRKFNKPATELILRIKYIILYFFMQARR